MRRTAWIVVCVSAALGSLHACASQDPALRASEEVSSPRADDPSAQAASPGEDASQCPLLDPEACRASDACQVVRGARVVARPGGGHCLLPRTDIACIASQECEEALSYFCRDHTIYEVPDTCGPVGWRECPAPEPLQRACE